MWTLLELSMSDSFLFSFMKVFFDSVVRSSLLLVVIFFVIVWMNLLVISLFFLMFRLLWSLNFIVIYVIEQIQKMNFNSLWLECDYALVCG